MSEGRSLPRDSRDEVLISDLDFPWEHGCPYTLLNRRLAAANQPTLGPASSMRDVHDAFFDLQVGASADDVAAWHQLKAAPKRLVVDFFHYPVPDFRMETMDPSALERPMPVATPDLLALADCRIDLEVPDAPDNVLSHELPLAELIEFGLAELLPSPLCEAAPQLSDVTEVSDDAP